MTRILILLALFLSSEIAAAQATASPCYWQGQLVKCFPTTGIYLDGNRSVRFGETTGNGSNYVEMKAPASLSSNPVLTLPEATDTLVGKATTDTLTNKTIDANGTGNSISNIENADIAAGAAIAYSKLNLATSIVNADVSGSAAIAGSKIVTATAAVAGVVDTGAQSFAGLKTFNDGLKVNDGSAPTNTTISNYAETTFSSTWTFNGTSGGTTASRDYTVRRLNDLCTLTGPVTTATTGSANTTSLTANTNIPTGFQPSGSNVFQPAVSLMISGTYQTAPGWVQINSAGTMIIYRDGSAATLWGNGLVAGSDGWLLTVQYPCNDS